MPTRNELSYRSAAADSEIITDARPVPPDRQPSSSRLDRNFPGISRRKDSYRDLLTALIALTIAYPLINAWPAGRLIEQFAMVGVLITSTLAVYKYRFQFALGLLVGAITLVVGFINYADESANRWLQVTQLIATTLFLLHATLTLTRDIFASREQVSSSLLYGAVSVYVLIGMTFAGGHFLLESLAPGSYQCGSSLCHHTPKMTPYMYFSFITLATVGYGEIVPATPLAAMLAYSEAVIGQMYTAVLVARLVGMHLVQSRARDADQPGD